VGRRKLDCAAQEVVQGVALLITTLVVVFVFKQLAITTLSSDSRG
jgi:hypothetical protein